MKFIRINPNLIKENATPIAPVQQLDEIDALADTIDDNMGKEVHVPKDVLDSFKIKNTLNPEIWPEGELNPKVQKNLIKIASGFIKDINLPKGIKIKDIIFTGSLANYNWSKFSDIDLHVVLDFNQFDADPEMIQNYFNSQKNLWNQEHDITIFGYPVELYVQDTNAKLVATAVYSVLRNEWIRKPKRETFKLDKVAIKDKAQSFISQLKDIRDDYKDKQYQSVIDKVTKVKAKIKQMRKAGLESGGEFSLENLVFKVLRRTPFMDILDSFKAKAYDNLMSVMERTSMIDEGEVLDNTTFIYKREDEDETTINAVYNNQRIASLSMVAMVSAYWYFEDDMSEDEYYELFPDDEFIQIGYLNVYDKKYMGEGIAKKLMKLAIDKAKKEGFDTIYLNASPMGTEGLKINNLVDFYKKFGFKEIINQGNNVQMILHANSKQLNEAVEYPKLGTLFIKGPALEDGTHRLYATSVNNVIVLGRKKIDDTSGEPVKMAVFGNNQVFRVGLIDGKLKNIKVGWKSNQSMLEKMGLTKPSIGLHYNKTPNHEDSLKITQVPQAINSLSSELQKIPDIRWVG
jgi:GNAT superfamily N-acetyltransferase